MDRGDEAEQPTSGDPSMLGVDIGGTSIKWSLIGGSHATDAHGWIPTPRVDERAVLDAVVGLVRELEIAPDAIGVAVPGTVDPVTRRSVFIPNLPGEWAGLAVAERLESELLAPVALINDARAFAWAELTSGAAHDVPRALFVTLGTGVGGAVALDGQVLGGRLDDVGEMGHVIVDPAGELCLCGGRGCLETVASATAIVSRLARTVATHQSPLLRRLTVDGAVPLTAVAAAQAARDGDPWAIEAFARAGDALGRATAGIALVLQLDAVIVGGGLAPASDLFLPAVQRVLDERTSLTGPIAVRRAHHGPEAGSRGAAAFARARILTPPPPKPIHPERTHP